MSYEAQVLRAATDRLAQRRAAQEQEYQTRREQVYARLPRLSAIHRQLRRTVASAAVTAFRTGGDPAAALKKLEQQNLSLQQEAEALLRGAGYPADYLDEQPLCPLCKDTGWRGAVMCGCLKSLCTEEQNKQLSSLLDLQGQSFEVFRLDYYGSVYSTDRTAMQTIYNTCKLYAEQFATFPQRGKARIAENSTTCFSTITNNDCLSRGEVDPLLSKRAKRLLHSTLNSPHFTLMLRPRWPAAFSAPAGSPPAPGPGTPAVRR